MPRKHPVEISIENDLEKAKAKLERAKAAVANAASEQANCEEMVEMYQDQLARFAKLKKKRSKATPEPAADSGSPK